MNKKLFSFKKTEIIPITTTHNKSGSIAYEKTAEETLANFAVLGTFYNTFYVSGEEQLKTILELCKKISPRFISEVAVYGREKAHMKDMPVVLLSWLACNGHNELVRNIFHKVITNTKQLRKLVEIIRSGEMGRKSFGSTLHKLINEFLTSKTGNQLFTGSVGTPSMKTIIRWMHPKPRNEEQIATFRYFIDKEPKMKDLPEKITQFELFKKGLRKTVPDVPFMMLTNCKLTLDNWKQIAKNMPWNTLRMNLNMLSRNNVFGDSKMVDYVADKLSNRDEVLTNNIFPYQLFTTYKHTVEEGNMPSRIANALQDALEVSTENVPALKGNIVFGVDVSTSMSWSVTGRGSTGVASKTKSVEVAALMASCLLRKNPNVEIMPFTDRLVPLTGFNGRDSIMTNAQKLARLCGGGTACSIPLMEINAHKKNVDLVVIFSDNESWAEYKGSGRQGTVFQQEWAKIKKRNPKAKLILVDVQPQKTSQAHNDKDVLLVGGFSNDVFSVIDQWYNDRGVKFPEYISKEAKRILKNVPSNPVEDSFDD